MECGCGFGGGLRDELGDCDWVDVGDCVDVG